MTKTLDDALDLSYVARDRILACGSNWPEGMQEAALGMSDLMAKITSITDVLSTCETESCVREQGRALAETAGDAVKRYESVLARFDDWREQAPRCRKVVELTGSTLEAFQRYGQASRIFDPAEMVESYNAANQLVLQRQQQIQTCLSG